MNKLFYMNVNAFKDRDAFDRAYAKMCDERKKKIDSHKMFSDKLRSLCAGILIENGLKEYGLSQKDVSIMHGEHGKPYIPGHEEINYNVSHSGDYSICAFSDSPVGVDIERITDYNDLLLKKLASRGEAEAFSSIPQDKKNFEFFSLWTKKESYLKYTGQGISTDLRTLFQGNEDKIQSLNFFKGTNLNGYVYTICTPLDMPEIVEITADEYLS